MAGNIKGITVEIGGSTTKLVSALKEVDKEIRGTQKELREIEKLLKLDPKDTELLAQKQRALGDAGLSLLDWHLHRLLQKDGMWDRA